MGSGVHSGVSILTAPAASSGGHALLLSRSGGTLSDMHLQQGGQLLSNMDILTALQAKSTAQTHAHGLAQLLLGAQNGYPITSSLACMRHPLNSAAQVLASPALLNAALYGPPLPLLAASAGLTLPTRFSQPGSPHLNSSTASPTKGPINVVTDWCAHRLLARNIMQPRF